MITATLAAYALTISFAGGSAPALADALKKAHGKVAVVLATSANIYKPFKIETDDPFIFSTRFFKITGLRAPKKGSGYAPSAWPAYMMPISPFGREKHVWGKEEIEPWTIEPSGEKFRISRKGSGLVRVSDLTSVGFKKPVLIPDFYGRAVIGISSGTYAARQILDAVSESVGAVVVESPSAYRLKFNPATFRPRLTQHLAEEIQRLEQSALDPVYIAQAHLCHAAFESLSNTQLESIFEGETKEMLVDVAPSSRAAALAERYLVAVANRRDIANMRSGQLQKLVERMDFDRGLKLYVDTEAMRVSVQAYDKKVPTGGIRL
jgi:hypothetical protein